MKFIVQLHEACFVTWRFEVEAKSEDEAKWKVRKGRAGQPVSSHVEPMPGKPTMLEIIDETTKH